MFFVMSNSGALPVGQDSDPLTAFDDLDIIEQMVLISLLSDARLSDDLAIPDASNNRRGWWADLWSPIANDGIGSLLWTLERAKATKEKEIKALAMIRDALQWLVDQGIATSIAVESERVADRINYAVAVARPADTTKIVRFSQVW